MIIDPGVLRNYWGRVDDLNSSPVFFFSKLTLEGELLTAGSPYTLHRREPKHTRDALKLVQRATSPSPPHSPHPPNLLSITTASVRFASGHLLVVSLCCFLFFFSLSTYLHYRTVDFLYRSIVTNVRLPETGGTFPAARLFFVPDVQ